MEMTWRKSSYSNSNGGNCVEVGTWRKSSYSSVNGGECVEAGTWRERGRGTGAAVAVRDTKDNGTGPVLRFTPQAWSAFTITLR